MFLSGLQDGCSEGEQSGLRLVDLPKQEIDRRSELQRTELDRGLASRVLELEGAAEGVTVEPVILDELDVCAKGEGISKGRLITRRRGELLRPAGVRQRTGEVGHRQQRESQIRLQLCHAAGFGPGLPDRILEEFDRRRKALPECDLGDQPVRPGPCRRIACRREDLLGQRGRPDDVAGSLVMLGRSGAA